MDAHCEFSALIHAGKGPGLEASQNLYAKHGGYALNNGSHKIVFSYVKAAPSLIHLAQNSLFKLPDMRKVDAAVIERLGQYQRSFAKRLAIRQGQLWDKSYTPATHQQIKASFDKYASALQALNPLMTKESWGGSIAQEDMIVLQSLIKDTDLEVLNYLDRCTVSKAPAI